MTQYVRLSQTDQNWEFEKILWWRCHQISDLPTNMDLVLDTNKYCSTLMIGSVNWGVIFERQELEQPPLFRICDPEK